MTWDNLQGVLRALLSFGGGYLVSSGLLTSQMEADLVGAVLVIGSAIWSLIHNSAQTAAAK